eukprot:1853702-Amphidinium_carterae.1
MFVHVIGTRVWARLAKLSLSTGPKTTESEPCPSQMISLNIGCIVTGPTHVNEENRNLLPPHLRAIRLLVFWCFHGSVLKSSIVSGGDMPSPALCVYVCLSARTQNVCCNFRTPRSPPKNGTPKK